MNASGSSRVAQRDAIGACLYEYFFCFFPRSFHPDYPTFAETWRPMHES
jgi:hypothetical protein